MFDLYKEPKEPGQWCYWEHGIGPRIMEIRVWEDGYLAGDTFYGGIRIENLYMEPWFCGWIAPIHLCR
jgi:hypothetical protein